MAIVPVNPSQDLTSTSADTKTRRTFGFGHPTRRTFGINHPTRRTFGINHPSRRTFGKGNW
jgi:hypothetical protein